jgi:hypothetical protein
VALCECDEGRLTRGIISVLYVSHTHAHAHTHTHNAGLSCFVSTSDHQISISTRLPTLNADPDRRVRQVQCGVSVYLTAPPIVLLSY